ncbi:MAG: MFS transporter [Alphaproteobacteria bacterium]|nr:MFS transporter [Alphaproteobacteria bacterium]MBF0249177.1 MFS transporter [Alphaproteobacteria bacterium]
MTDRPIQPWHWNTLYLLLACSTIIMTLSAGLQPLFLNEVLGVTGPRVGVINASVQTAAEVVSLGLIAFLGYYSDRVGRGPIVYIGFLVAAAGAFLAILSPWLGAMLGVGALSFYFLTRILVFLGLGAVWPQLTVLAGDYTTYETRPGQFAKVLFMMTFGGSVIYAVLMQIPEYGGLYVVMALTVLIALGGAWLARGHHLPDVAPHLGQRTYPFEQLRKLTANEPRMQLAFVSAFFSRSDMVFVAMFLMLWFLNYGKFAGFSREEAVAVAGGVLGVLGIVIMVALPAWGMFIRQRGRVLGIAVGMAISAAGFLGIGLMGTPFTPWILVPIALIGVGQAGCLISPQVMAMDHTPKNLRGTVMGAFSVLGGLGIIFFVQSGGMLFDIVGPHAPFVLIGLVNVMVMTYAFSMMPYDTGAETPAKKPKIGFKPVVFSVCLLPMLVPLMWLVDSGGANHHGAFGGLPLGYWNRYTGVWALNFLIISLALRPMREMSKVAQLARYNRMIGLFAFFYAVLHVLTYLWLEIGGHSLSHMWSDFWLRWFIPIGIIAFVLLTVLAITSHKYWSKRLGGKQWKFLQRSVYAVNVLVLLHFIVAADMADSGMAKALVYTAIVFALFTYRVRQYMATHDMLRQGLDPEDAKKAAKLAKSKGHGAPKTAKPVKAKAEA